MNGLIKMAVRSKFRFTSRQAADAIIINELHRYQVLCENLRPGEGTQKVRVPAMPGIDPEMRDWSLFEILEHNVIVNDVMSRIVVCLATGEEDPDLDRFDPKHDTLPSSSAGEEQVAAHSDSIIHHLEAVEDLPELNTAAKRDHPVFGPLNAHGWHCMLGFHLGLHFRQAKAVLKRLRP